MPSIKESLKHVMPFGKFKGKSLRHIMKNEPSYFNFLKGIKTKEPHKSHIANVIAFLEDEDADEENTDEDDPKEGASPS